MSVPALLVDFPSSQQADHASAACRLRRQWRIFFHVGNVFFRPISTLGIVGYAYASLAAAASAVGPGAETRRVADSDWRPYALSACCHLVTVVHSALNMQPLNRRILEDNGPETLVIAANASRWARLNLVRLVMPLVAGSVALWTRLKK